MRQFVALQPSQTHLGSVRPSDICCCLRRTLKIAQQCVSLFNFSSCISINRVEPRPDSFTDWAFIVCSRVYSSGAYKNPGATLGQKIEAGQESGEIPASLQLSAPSKVMKN